jgi:hypothetical protein
MIRFCGALLRTSADQRLRLQNLQIRDLRRLIYYVPSEDVILKASLRENLSLGDNAEEDVLREAVEVAGIDFATWTILSILKSYHLDKNRELPLLGLNKGDLRFFCLMNL